MPTLSDSCTKPVLTSESSTVTFREKRIPELKFQEKILQKLFPLTPGFDFNFAEIKDLLLNKTTIQNLKA